MSEVVRLDLIRTLAARYPTARVSSLLRRIEQDRQRAETEFNLRLAVMAIVLCSIVERECKRETGKC